MDRDLVEWYLLVHSTFYHHIQNVPCRVNLNKNHEVKSPKVILKTTYIGGGHLRK